MFQKFKYQVGRWADAFSRSHPSVRGPEFLSAYLRCIIIGAQKGGTSALAAYLGHHPEMNRPEYKELDYFGSDPHYQLGFSWYTQKLSPEQPAPGTFGYDASPHYLLSPDSAGRISADCPDAGLVVLLREPVERAFSAWNMCRVKLSRAPDFYRHWNLRCYSREQAAGFVKRIPEELEDFKLACEKEIDLLKNGGKPEWSILEYGLYGPQLRHFRRFFPASQFLIIESSELKRSPARVMDRVVDFLGISPFNWPDDAFPPVHVGDYSGTPDIAPSTVRLLNDFYAESNRMLVEDWDLKFDWL